MTKTKYLLLITSCVALLSVYILPKFFPASASASPSILKGHENSVTALDVSATGNLIATARLDHTVRLWDVRSGKTSRVLRGHKTEVYAVRFSPNDKLVASSSYDGEVIIWDVPSGKLLHTLKVTDWTTTLDFSADSGQLAVGSQSRNVTIFDVQTGNILRTIETENPVNVVAFSPNGNYLAIGYRAVEIWDLQANKIIKTLRQRGVTALAFSPDSRFLASGSGDKSARLWNLETGEQLKKLETETPINWQFASGNRVMKMSLPVTSVAISPDGKSLAMGTGRAVHLWDVSTGNQLRTLEGHTASVTDVRFLPHGNSLVSSSLDRTVRVWNLKE